MLQLTKSLDTVCINVSPLRRVIQTESSLSMFLKKGFCNFFEKYFINLNGIFSAKYLHFRPLPAGRRRPAPRSRGMCRRRLTPRLCLCCVPAGRGRPLPRAERAVPLADQPLVGPHLPGALHGRARRQLRVPGLRHVCKYANPAAAAAAVPLPRLSGRAGLPGCAESS